MIELENILIDFYESQGFYKNLKCTKIYQSEKYNLTLYNLPYQPLKKYSLGVLQKGGAILKPFSDIKQDNFPITIEHKNKKFFSPNTPEKLIGSAVLINGRIVGRLKSDKTIDNFYQIFLDLTTQLFSPQLGGIFNSTIDKVCNIIDKYFMHPDDNFDQSQWNIEKKKLISKKYSNSTQEYDAIRQIVASLKEPYTKFLDPKQSSQKKKYSSGKFTGVGVQISKDIDSGYFKVVATVMGSPASQVGIATGDLLISIDNMNTQEMYIDQAINLIRGETGSTVDLEFIRRDNKIKHRLIRQPIDIKSVASKINSTEGVNIGYIGLRKFKLNSAQDMRKTIKALDNKVDGYVLDLRGNVGGWLNPALAICQQFIDKGVILLIKSKNSLTVKKAKGKAITNKPMVVLINEGSASSSEILAGAIQDNNRGKLVGLQTYGKGLIQNVMTLNDGSEFTVTTSKYLTPGNKNINKLGITPDVWVESESITEVEIGTTKDKQYVEAVKILLENI